MIEVIQACASPQSKWYNQVFATLRWLLPWHLAHTGATSREDANAFLDGYWTKYNEAFVAESEDDVFDPLNPYSLATLDGSLCLKEEKIVGCDNRVGYAGKQLQIPESDVEPRVSYEGQRVQIHEYEDGALTIMGSGNEVLGRFEIECSELTDQGERR